MHSAYDIGLVLDTKLCNGCNACWRLSSTSMASMLEYGITPTERGKSEVTMRIVVENWYIYVVIGSLGGYFSYVSYIRHTSLHLVPLQNLRDDLP